MNEEKKFKQGEIYEEGGYGVNDVRWSQFSYRGNDEVKAAIKELADDINEAIRMGFKVSHIWPEQYLYFDHSVDFEISFSREHKGEIEDETEGEIEDEIEDETEDETESDMEDEEE